MVDFAKHAAADFPCCHLFHGVWTTAVMFCPLLDGSECYLTVAVAADLGATDTT